MRCDSVVVRHGGHEYATTAEMAEIFERQASRALATGAPELVVLRHSKGLELLLITEGSCFSVEHPMGSSA